MPINSAADQNVGDVLKEFAEQYRKEHRRNRQRHRALIGKLSSGELDARELRSEYARFAEEQNPGYMRQLAELTFGFLNGLTKLGSSYNDEFYARVLGIPTARELHREQGRRADVSRVLIEAEGAQGSLIERSIVIENRKSTPARISFVVSDVEGPDGELFRVPVQIEPHSFVLAARAECVVAVRLQLFPEVYNVVGTYSLQILVRGDQSRELVLNIRVTEPAVPSSAPAESSPNEAVLAEPIVKPQESPRTQGASGPRARAKSRASAPRKRTGKKKAGARTARSSTTVADTLPGRAKNERRASKGAPEASHPPRKQAATRGKGS